MSGKRRREHIRSYEGGECCWKLTDEAEDDLKRGSGFCRYKGERYENWPRRGHIRPYRDFEYKGDFDDLGEVNRNLGSIKLKIPAFKGKTDPEAYLD